MSLELSETYKESHIKAILLGSQGVGKTNLINVCMDKGFNPDSIPTVGQNFSRKKVEYNNKKYFLEVWDTIGQEKLRTINKLFYKNSKIVIFVYDITNLDSFKDLKHWVEEIDNQIGMNNVVKGVVGNKIDLFLDEQVKDSDGRNFAESIGAEFLQTSAKTDPSGIFASFITNLMKDYINFKSGNAPCRKPGITLDYTTTFRKRKKKKCCDL